MHTCLSCMCQVDSMLTWLRAAVNAVVLQHNVLGWALPLVFAHWKTIFQDFFGPLIVKCVDSVFFSIVYLSPLWNQCIKRCQNFSLVPFCCIYTPIFLQGGVNGSSPLSVLSINFKALWLFFEKAYLFIWYIYILPSITKAILDSQVSPV